MSLNVFLLHNGNRYPFVPSAHTAKMKESYESMKVLLVKIKCNDFNWKFCGDLKVVTLLLGMQLGCRKYCCFRCEWDSWDKKNDYVNKLWSKRSSLTPGKKNVVNPPLVLLEKIYLTTLYIKLGLMKNFVKSTNKTDRGFEYVRSMFPKVSDAKFKEVIFVGPQNSELMQVMRE
jgi:hypothetical protein